MFDWQRAESNLADLSDALASRVPEWPDNKDFTRMWKAVKILNELIDKYKNIPEGK